MRWMAVCVKPLGADCQSWRFLEGHADSGVDHTHSCQRVHTVYLCNDSHELQTAGLDVMTKDAAWAQAHICSLCICTKQILMGIASTDNVVAYH